MFQAEAKGRKESTCRAQGPANTTDDMVRSGKRDGGGKVTPTEGRAS